MTKKSPEVRPCRQLQSSELPIGEDRVRLGEVLVDKTHDACGAAEQRRVWGGAQGQPGGFSRRERPSLFIV